MPQDTLQAVGEMHPKGFYTIIPGPRWFMSSVLALTLLDKQCTEPLDPCALHTTSAPGLLRGPTSLNLCRLCGAVPWSIQSTTASRACRGGSAVTVPGMSWGVQGPMLSSPRGPEPSWRFQQCRESRAEPVSTGTVPQGPSGRVCVAPCLANNPVSHQLRGTVSSGLSVPVPRNSHSQGSKSSFLSPYIQRLLKN